MDEKSEQLLADFAKAANKGQLHDEDWRRFFKFTVYVHRNQIPFKGSNFTNWLFAHGFTTEMASKLSADFKRFRELLYLYEGAT